MATDVEDSRVGVALGRAVSITGVSAARLRRWERAELVSPRAARKVGARHAVRIYGFDELVEIRIVRALEDRGAHIKLIEKLLREVREWQARSGRAAHRLRWAVGQREPFVEIDGMWTGGREPRQGVMPELLDLDHLREEVRSRLGERPEAKMGRTERRRGALGSKDVFAGTRTPVDAVIAYVKRGATDNEIIEAFPHLTAADIALARAAITQA